MTTRREDGYEIDTDTDVSTSTWFGCRCRGGSFDALA
jgi:hypothetical protein